MDRQRAMMEERVTRMKYERTMTRKGSVANLGSKGFIDEAQELGSEAMEEKAKALQEQFNRSMTEASVQVKPLNF